MSRTLPIFLKKIISKKENKPKRKFEKITPKKVVEIVFESEDELLENDVIIFTSESDDDDDDVNPSGCTVVKITRKGGKVDVDCDIYIGRRCTMGGWNLQESKWHNPFKVDEENTIHKVINDFYLYMKGSARFGGRNLMAELHELKGKVLGCWCKKKGNEPCHGDVLVKLLNEQIREERRNVRETKRKNEEAKRNKEMSDNAMALLEKLLEENRQKIKEKKEQEETTRKGEKDRIRTVNEKQWVRRQEVIEKYGVNHEMASQCKEIDRPLTPISPPTMISPLVDDEEIKIHTIDE